QRDHKREPSRMRIVDAHTRDAISLLIPVRDIKIQAVVRAVPAQELVETGYRRRPIDVIVSIDQYLLFHRNGPHDAVHRFPHVLHQPGIVHIAKPWTEKTLSLFESFDTSLDQYPAKGLVDPEGGL